MRKVDLLREDNKIFTFDFHENKVYTEFFEIKGDRKEKKGYNYSYSNTFWLALLLIFVINIMGLLLDKMIVINPIIGSVFGIVSMLVLVKISLKFFRGMIIIKSKEEASKTDIISILEKPIKGYRVLEITNWLLILLLILLITIVISNNKMSGKDFITTNLLVIVIAFIQSYIYPNQVIKAHKILKTKMKEGKFDD